jgi:hypothetical protein
MATIIEQVNELADLQGRSAAILTLARRNAEIRTDIGRKTAEITAQINRVGEALRAAQLVAARVVGANDKQTEHLNNLEAALNQAPTAEELNVQVDVLSALTKGLGEGPPAAPPSNLSANTPAFVPASPPVGGYRYSRRRKTPTRRKTATRKRTPSRGRRKHKTHRRR